MSKIVDLPDPVAIGSKLTYTVIAVNGGTEDSTTSGKEVLVRLDGPVTGVIFASATGWSAAVHGSGDACYWVALGADGQIRYGAGSPCTGMAALAADRRSW